MTAPLPPLSRSVEDYLKAIYGLSETADEQGVATSEIAEKLALAPASVTGMIKRMAESGLLEHEPYRGVKLTDEGQKAALAVMRRHRILETYLIRKLGYDWANVHEEAERLEHAVSDTLIERMAKVLGDPQEDPHGDPIPGPDGSLAEMVYVPLADLSVGEEAEIRRVNTSQPDRLRYIGATGLMPGTHVELVAREPFQGPLRLKVGDREQIIGHELAGMLWCVKRGEE